MKKALLGLSTVISLSLLAGCAGNTSPTADSIRVGYFPNITHAQALIGIADGTFQEKLGDTKVEASTFNAGPAEMEALLAGQIDLAYVGPSPALNAFVQSQGEALKIVAGNMSGGAAFVVQPELAEAYNTSGASALVGKTLASPQQGNTQDVSLRSFLNTAGILDQVTVSPMANADQLSLFQQKQLDGAWAPEPWASRLVEEAGGTVLIDERTLWPDESFATTVIIVRTEFLQDHPEFVQKWLEGQIEVTNWIAANPVEAQAKVNDQIETLTGAALDEAVLAQAWDRLDPTYTPNQASIEAFREDAEALGFIDGTGIDFTKLYDLTILNDLTSQ